MGAEPLPADRVADLVETALELDPPARAAFLAGACAGDGALRLEVESLLGFQARARGFMETPVFAFGVADAADAVDDAPGGGGELRAGETVGECEIISLLGVGGMGEVYLARDTALDRRVAVKLIRRGMAGNSILRRFQHERRVLAGLNHPHIARLYGGAVTADGRPSLVMEYVEGERLDHYCERHRLPVAARLALFRKVCSAVAYAHQNLVIHRDLKPGNILVTAEGEPMLLDFGIAKMLDPDATETPDPTMTLSGGAMTPGYASPEQLRGDPITTASDIYSLGVVLYELLTGGRPHRAARRRTGDFGQVPEDSPTERPSAAVARTATATEGGKTLACGETAERLCRRLRGDLDNIVLMAMRAEPARRYVSVSQFSEDLRRHGEGRPVVARRDTPGYRAGKFVRRNKTAVAAAVLLFLSLVAGVVATARQAARADRRFNDVRRLANSILFEVDPLIAYLPGSIPARTALVRHALEYLDSLSHESGNDPTLRRELATAYEKVGDVQGNPSAGNVGEIQGALTSYGKARELRLALVKADAHDLTRRHELADNYEQTGLILWWMNQTEKAQAAYGDALALRRALLAVQPRSADYRRGMASLQEKIGDIPNWNSDTPRAMAAYKVALPLRRELAAEQPDNARAQIDLARCLRRVGGTLKDADDYASALSDLAEAQALIESIVRRSPGDNLAQAELWSVEFARCELYLQQNDGDRASPICPGMIALAETLLRLDPQDVGSAHRLANSHTYFGGACVLTKKYEQAIEEFGKALEIDSALSVKSPKTNDYQRASALHRLGMCRAQRLLGRLDDALASAQAALPMLEQSAALDADDLAVQHDLASVYEQFGKIHVARQRPGEAREAYQRAITHLQKIAAAHPLNKVEAGSLAEIQDEAAALR